MRFAYSQVENLNEAEMCVYNYVVKNKAISIARNFKKSGIDIRVISENTGLSIEEIEKL